MASAELDAVLIVEHCALLEQAGRKSGAAKNYVVSGVPTAYLIDADGKIHYVGHPDECDLEAAIKEILAAGQ